MNRREGKVSSSGSVSRHRIDRVAFDNLLIESMRRFLVFWDSVRFYGEILG